MGIHVIEEARIRHISETGLPWHYLRLPEVHLGLISRGKPLERPTRRNERPLRHCQESSQGYRQEFGFTGIYLLPVNLYGPGDHFDLETGHVIPAVVRKFLHAKASTPPSVMLRGDGSPTREFLYVEDAADGIVTAAEGYHGPDPVNLGSGEEISIRDLADTIRVLVGYAGSGDLGLRLAVPDPARHGARGRRRSAKRSTTVPNTSPTTPSTCATTSNWPKDSRPEQE